MNMKETNSDTDGGIYIVSVYPLSRGAGKDQLTYFTAKRVSPGALVSVPIRNKTTDAIVVSVRSAHISKSELKAASFSIKKIVAVKAEDFFLPSFVEAAEETARYFATHAGAVLHSLVPQAILSSSKSIAGKTMEISAKKSPDSSDQTSTAERQTGFKQQALLLQAEDEERISTYKSIIREEFARQSSVFFCVPELSEIERTKETLARGIEEYTYVLHSGLTKKQIGDMWERALKEEHPVLIIGTGTFLSLPRTDISTVILEKESSRSYKSSARPFIDIRTFAEIFTRRRGIRFIMGDILLRPETIFHEKEGRYTAISPLKFRALSTADQTIVDMTKYTEKFGDKEFRLVSDELALQISDARENGENIFILTARRGLFPLTVCNDCGNTVLCSRCSAPTVLHKNTGNVPAQDGLPTATSTVQAGKNISLCHKCGKVEEAIDRCSVCKGWRLATLGIGIANVEEVLKKKFPGIKIFRLDRDIATTHKKALEIRNKFYATPGSVLLGTEMAVAYLTKEIAGVAVLSVDSLFTIPDFRINERVFTMLLRLRGRAAKHFLIQTRDMENRIFDYATKGNMADFYREEIAERKILGYPPFATLIKFTLEGNKLAVEKEMERLSGILKENEYEPAVFPAFIATVKGKYRMNLLLKLPAGQWVDEKLLAIIRGLSPAFAVRVDPEDVL